MNKKIKLICLLMALICCATLVFAACKGDDNDDVQVDEDGNIIAGPGGKATNITFWINGDDNELLVFKNIVDNFNKQYEGTIKVTMVNRSGDYSTSLGQALAGRNAPDVFYVEDALYKEYAQLGYLADITEEVKKSTKYNTENMWTNAVNRYLYNVDTGLSGTADGHYYGVPKDIGPTVIFYNETFFEQAGITCISVAAEDLAAFNAGTKKDDKGKFKSEYGLTSEVKEKGYFYLDGKYFFNNQVAMNWEETRDCANKVQDWMRDKDGGNIPKGYGYFTEWWFNYGWTVGGNVIQEIPTDDPNYNGYFWDFTLMDETKNYIVADNVESVEVNGKTYHAGEIIAYTDKIDMSNYAKNSGEAKDKKNTYNVTSEITSLVNQHKLNVLPSQREAFVEFVRLAAKKDITIDGINGYEITPYPSSLGGDGAKASAFQIGQLAMLVDGRWNVTKFREQMGKDESDVNWPAKANKYKWDVAPLPVYKEYDAQGNITVHGIDAGHSGSVALCVSNKTKVSTAAWLFIEYCASLEGQSLQAEAGFAIPLDKNLANSEVFLQTNLFPHNSKVFLRAAEAEQAGDWWMLPDGKWINDWAGVLNSNVRNGTKTLTEFYNSTQYNNTFALLDKYCKKK